MATKSFDEDLVLDTEEAVNNYIRAIDLAERNRLDLSEAKGVCKDPEVLDRLVGNND